MLRETMTTEERIIAAVKLQPYDRVPVAPHINAEYPFRRKGRSLAEAYDPKYAEDCFQETLALSKESGGWDAVTLAYGAPLYPEALAFYRGRGQLGGYRYPGRSAMISRESSPQYEEKTLMSIEDYDLIIKLGWRGFLKKTSEETGAEQADTNARWRRFAGDTSEKQARASLESRTEIATRATKNYLGRLASWKQNGLAVVAGHLMIDPQMMLSLLRTLHGFTMDLHRMGDKVKAALDAMVDDMTEDAIKCMNAAGGPSASGLPGIMMACERGSGQYYNLKIFEKYVWPYIKKMVLAWAKEGYVTTLHFDTDWTLNMPYLKELPRAMVICEPDSTTDIFKAHEILKGHTCFMGDVPPSISSHGTVKEMEDYCEKLIQVVGKGTGLILSNGCAVPPDTKDENFWAMMNSVKKFATGS
ncbi:MAG: uroporphyrinogen decarboxylase family protein [Dehalococcoidia bacterium]|nr:uroporphyrinogen decarboxylase family protein [Dehalococcoidia bacterium]